jgi:hypothetical protein
MQGSGENFSPTEAKKEGVDGKAADWEGQNKRCRMSQTVEGCL